MTRDVRTLMHLHRQPRMAPGTAVEGTRAAADPEGLLLREHGCLSSWHGIPSPPFPDRAFPMPDYCLNLFFPNFLLCLLLAIAGKTANKGLILWSPAFGMLRGELEGICCQEEYMDAVEMAQ